MRIALLGATSATGLLVIGAALREGHEIRAMVRGARPGSGVRNLPLKDGLFQLAGTSTDPGSVRELVRSAEAVICLVGPVRESAPDLCSRTAEALVQAASDEAVRRIVLVTGAMIGHPPEHAHGLYRVVPTLLGATREDRRESERMVREGAAARGMAWCIVRPPRLGDGPSEHWVTVGPEIEIGTMDAIPRIDLAEILVEAALGRWDGQALAARTAHTDERHEAFRVLHRARRDTTPLPARRRPPTDSSA